MKTHSFRRITLILLLCLAGLSSHAQFTIRSGNPIAMTAESSENQVVHISISLLARDYENVFSDKLEIKTDGADIIVGTVGSSRLLAPFTGETAVLKDKVQAFMIKVLPDGRLLIAGNDSHGTAYGVMELCRMIGVSPWEWWADAEKGLMTMATTAKPSISSGRTG